jgi:hypothetical protein
MSLVLERGANVRSDRQYDVAGVLVMSLDADEVTWSKWIGLSGALARLWCDCGGGTSAATVSGASASTVSSFSIGWLTICGYARSGSLDRLEFALESHEIDNLFE